MIKFSDVQEELEIMRRAVLHEVNEGLDSFNTVDYSGLDISNREKLHDIENNLREILRIMSR